MAINHSQALSAHTFAYGESKKRDICIGYYDTDKEENTAAHIIEVKVCYPWTKSKLEDDKFLILKEQLLNASKKDKTTEIHGLVWGIWLFPFYSNYAYKKYEDKAKYFELLQTLTQKTFNNKKFKLHNEGKFDLLFDSVIKYTHKDEVEYQVQIGMHYLTVNR